MMGVMPPYTFNDRCHRPDGRPAVTFIIVTIQKIGPAVLHLFRDSVIRRILTDFSRLIPLEFYASERP